MEATAHCLVATEAEGDVGDATTDLAARAHALDFTSCTDEVHSIVVVFRHAGADGEHVGVKDDVLCLPEG